MPDGVRGDALNGQRVGLRTGAVVGGDDRLENNRYGAARIAVGERRVCQDEHVRGLHTPGRRVADTPWFLGVGRGQLQRDVVWTSPRWYVPRDMAEEKRAVAG